MNLKKSIFAACAAVSLAVSLNASAGNESGIKWPDAHSAHPKNGTFVDVEQLRLMATGMTKDQVRELIGAPHFSEGFFTPGKWNYLFNFRTGKGSEYVTCQYQVTFSRNAQVIFDENQVVKAMHWRESDCAKYLDNPSMSVTGNKK